MQIVEAIDVLKKAVGMACDAISQGGSESDGVGESICGSIAERVDDSAKSLSVQEIGPSGVHVDPVSGGSFKIWFSGSAQPEAARTLDSIITPILNDLEISDLHQHRRRLGESIDRIIPFYVQDDKAGAFVARLLEIARRIEKTPALREQFRAATNISLSHINNIRGARPHVRLVLGKGAEFEGEEMVVKPPHFELVIPGTPQPLAKKLAEISGQDIYQMPFSGKQSNRDHTDHFDNGGKTFTIAMDHPKASEVLTAIQQYVTAMRQFRPGGAGDDSFHSH